MIVELDGEAQPVRLQVTQDSLNIQREELVYTQSLTDNLDPEVLAQVSNVVEMQ